MKKQLETKDSHISTATRIFLFFVLDLFTKMIFQDAHIGIINSLLNPVAAWSIHISLIVLILLSICALVFLVYYYRKGYISKRSFILLIAGGCGNIYDRLMYQGVRDWIDIRIIPVFNIADVMITIGIILFIFAEYKKRKGNP